MGTLPWLPGSSPSSFMSMRRCINEVSSSLRAARTSENGCAGCTSVRARSSSRALPRPCELRRIVRADIASAWA
eukprot:scaffold91164_cov24-Phaeocystis_antarctica.AAC.1